MHLDADIFVAKMLSLRFMRFFRQFVGCSKAQPICFPFSCILIPPVYYHFPSFILTDLDDKYKGRDKARQLHHDRGHRPPGLKASTSPAPWIGVSC